MKLKVPKKNYGLAELYDTVAKAMGHKDVSKLNYDCKAINVARNIQDGFSHITRKQFRTQAKAKLR